MGVAAAAGLVFAVDKPLVQMAWTAWESLNSFTLLAMPMFIFMGAVFSGSGAVQLLFAALDKWLGWLPGGPRLGGDRGQRRLRRDLAVRASRRPPRSA